MTATRPELPARTERKRRAILEAATDAFLEHGYIGTSMDEVAARARVSKQTVYKHFGDKRRLFAAVVAAAVDEVAAPVLREVAELPPSGDVGADLRDLARRELTAVMQPRLLALRRMVIAEATRFPDAGRAFHERGSASTIAALAGMLERLDAAGQLRIDDPAAAAEHFNWLVMSAPMNRAMLLGERAGAEEIARYAESGVGAFLAAYGA